MNADQIQIMAYAEADAQPVFINCSRCGGQGGFACYGHIYNGVCFECNGARGHWSTVGEERRAEERRAKNAERRARRAEAKAAAKRAARDEFLAQHEGLADALDVDHHISADLAEKLLDFGSLSDKQVALALRIAREQAERAQARAEEPQEPVVEGRGPVVGEIVHIRSEEVHFGGRASLSVKVLIADDRGFRLWGTAPKSIRDQIAKGARVSLTATLTAKEDGFGFFSRPSRASIEIPPAE